MKNETRLIIKRNEYLTEFKIKNKIEQLNMEIMLTNTETVTLNSHANLRSSSKHVLHNLSIYYTWKNIRQQYKNNKLKVIALTWNDEFEFPSGS